MTSIPPVKGPFGVAGGGVSPEEDSILKREEHQAAAQSFIEGSREEKGDPSADDVERGSGFDHLPFHPAGEESERQRRDRSAPTSSGLTPKP